MCYSVVMPIICALQMVSRVFVTILFAIEDIVRLIIHTVHGYISTILHLFTFLPVCLAMCCAKKYCCNTLNPSGCYPRTASIGWNCIFIVIMIGAILVILYYSHWFEYLSNDFGITLPCVIFGKKKLIENTNKTNALNRIVRRFNESQNVDSSLRELEEIFRSSNNSIITSRRSIPNKTVRNKCKHLFNKRNKDNLVGAFIEDKSFDKKYETLNVTDLKKKLCNQNSSTEKSIEKSNTLHVEIKEDDYAKEPIPPLEDVFTNHDISFEINAQLT